jgi:hypothetical protein
MATQLELVNRVLLRLRENSVTTVIENDYSQLIAMFLNDAKADMEDVNHTWSAYETEVDLTILGDGTRDYTLPATNDRSFLMRRWKEDRIPLAFDITAGEEGQLWDIPLKELRVLNALLDNTHVDGNRPTAFSVVADNATDAGWGIRTVWGSTEVRNWRMYWYIPQDDLALDATDENTQLILPQRPLELRTYAYALMEREIENSPAAQAAWQRSVDSLSAALETDMQVQKKSDEIDIRNCESL